MARPSIENIRGLPDWAQVIRWDLQFSSIPAAINANITIDELNFRCESTALPTATVAAIETNIRGHKVKSPGIMSYGNTLDLVFAETVDSKIHSFFKAWRDAIWQVKTGVAAAPVADLKGSFLLNRLNNQDVQIWQYKVVGAYLENHSLPTLDGSSNDALKVTLTFSYDYYEDKAA
jgi:hypothetical protein